MPAPAGHYRVITLTADRRGDIDGLTEALFHHVRGASDGRATLAVADFASLTLSNDPSEPTTVAVLLSEGPATATDPAIIAAIGVCQKLFIPVIPVVNTLRDVHLQVPQLLLSINACLWATGTPADALTNIVLRVLGLSEEDRRIFLSHRRSDGSAMAEQLRTRLNDDRWDVFLDRFSVPPAVDFQRRLDRELADKTFVLLLETPQAAASRWVEHEIAFALRHRLGLMSITPANTKPEELFPAMHDSWRFRLNKTDIAPTPAGALLTDAALEAALDAIEIRYASALRLRRETVMTDASAELAGQDYSVTAVSEWGLLAQRDNQQEVLLVTARAPTPADLRTADGMRRRFCRRGTATRGWVVHPIEDIDQDRADLLRWLSLRRSVRPTPLMLLTDRMSA